MVDIYKWCNWCTSLGDFVVTIKLGTVFVPSVLCWIYVLSLLNMSVTS